MATSIVEPPPIESINRDNEQGSISGGADTELPPRDEHVHNEAPTPGINGGAPHEGQRPEELKSHQFLSAEPPTPARDLSKRQDGSSNVATGGDKSEQAAVAVAQGPYASAQSEAAVRYVEVRNPDGTGWAAMSKAVRDYDEEKVKYCKEDIDTLLVFAGLYSAVLSAFIIESYQSLKPDNGDTMVFLFQQMLAQNYSRSPNGEFLNATNPYPTLPPFKAPTWAIRVNVLWFSSLVVSLSAASFGMLVKQWLREYLDMEHTSPQERLRARQYRRPALDHWKVFEIAASLPLLLEVSLALFFVGLCYFTTAIHSSISNCTILFVAAWAFFFLVATVAPLTSPRCPFKTTLLRSVMRQGRKALLAIAHIAIHLCMDIAVWSTCIGRWASSTRAFEAGRKVVLATGKLGISAYDTAITPSITITWNRAFLALGNWQALRNARPTFPSLPARLLQPSEYHLILDKYAAFHQHLARLETFMKEETKVLGEHEDDIAILQSVEEIMPGDGLLPTIVDIACAIKPPLFITYNLVRRTLSNRIGKGVDLDDMEFDYAKLTTQRTRDFQQLSQQACDALTIWLSTVLQDSSLSALPWHIDFSSTFLALIFSHQRSLPELPGKVFHSLIFNIQDVFRISSAFSSAVGGRRRLHQVFADESTRWPTTASYKDWSRAIERLIIESSHTTEPGDHDIEEWVRDALFLLVSTWKTSASSGRPKKYRSRQPLSNQLIITVILPILSHIPWPSYFYFATETAKADLYYSILLSMSRSTEEDQFPIIARTRSLTSSLCLEQEIYGGVGDSNPFNPRTAFLSQMQSLSGKWTETMLGWLVPHRMPGNVLAEIVVADLVASAPEERSRKLKGIGDICQAVHPASDTTNTPSTVMLDFTSLFQIIIALHELEEIGIDEKPRIRAIQAAFWDAVTHRYRAYMLCIAISSMRSRGTHLKERGDVAWRLEERMRTEGVGSIHAIVSMRFRSPY